MNLGPTLVTLGAILGKKSHFYGLKSPIFVIIWSLRTNIEIYIKIDFYLMRGYAQCALAGKVHAQQLITWVLDVHHLADSLRTLCLFCAPNYFYGLKMQLT